MTALIDRIIATLAEERASLTALASTLTDEQLAAPSGASRWSVSEVLGHLGSGAEINLAGLRSALQGRAAPDAGYNQPVWDRWNAMDAEEKRTRYVEHSAALIDAYQALDRRQRDALEVDVFYMPTPLRIETYAGLRLNESALHGWDVRVSLDPQAELAAGSAELLAELLTDQISFMLSYTAKPDRVEEPVVLEIVGSKLAISIADTVTLGASTAPATALFNGSLAAAIRLIAGRLTPEHTPPDLQVTGNTTPAQLRQTFPGY